jgi:hypothetical protein
VLVLVELLQLLAPLFDRNFTRTVEVTLCNGQLPDLWAIDINLWAIDIKNLRHPLEVCIRKNI